jgi:hypothetical protein
MLRLHHDGGAVTQDFRYARHDLRRVIPDPDDRVGAAPLRMGKQNLERVGPRALAERGEHGDVAAEQGLDLGPDGAQERA